MYKKPTLKVECKKNGCLVKKKKKKLQANNLYVNNWRTPQPASGPIPDIKWSN